MRQKRRRPSPTITAATLTAALGALFVLAQPAASADSDGFVQFTNDLGYQVVVDILRTNGERQKGETIKPGKRHGFKFSGCTDKSRKFEIRKQSDDSLLADGSFSFQSNNEGDPTSPRIDCKTSLNKPPNPATYLQDLAIDFYKVNPRRGSYRVYMGNE